ncbi:hypothetical protein GCM10010358_15490 [Streptomyces minutiscleroticus]|uniref:Glutamate dehydrogenase n=1 Tax=Streptomyces minutiscleroticus TaxID=68238 RepID=A0A918KG01_9ACTN|nr:Glu/Leu/Phe/Val dehydrogenase dimerization domain-containing protein [Streptomyces minutiscleroticus]GGX62053.1 hypothetical protein GCM10010358_15490 [Streptomyces minutiscleroticus]
MVSRPDTKTVLASLRTGIERRNPAQPEFHQAVHEVLETLAPVLAARPEYAEPGLLERLCEPERQIIFRVPWQDDRGRVHVNRGFRVEFNSALGPYKGGLRFHPSVDLGIVKSLTGKGRQWGGSAIRPEATGYGNVLFAAAMLRERGEDLAGRTAVVSGSGNVAIHTIEKLTALGANPLTCSDSSGYVIDEKGVDLELLKQVKEVERTRISVYAERRGASARFVPGGRVREVPAGVALPSATQNELDEDDAAALIRNGVKAVSEGANMPATPRAVELFREAGVAFGPGKAANAGGVAVSALEMAQNAARTVWAPQRVEDELARVMNDVHTTCRETAERYGAPGDHVTGADIAGFERVAGAMLA